MRVLTIPPRLFAVRLEPRMSNVETAGAAGRGGGEGGNGGGEGGGEEGGKGGRRGGDGTTGGDGGAGGGWLGGGEVGDGGGDGGGEEGGKDGRRDEDGTAGDGEAWGGWLGGEAGAEVFEAETEHRAARLNAKRRLSWALAIEAGCPMPCQAVRRREDGRLQSVSRRLMSVTAAAALATKADAANVRARPRLAGQCEKWLARPNTQRAIPAFARPPPSPCPHTRPHNCPHNCPHARPHTWPGAFAQMSARFHPRCAGGRVGGG